MKLTSSRVLIKLFMLCLMLPMVCCKKGEKKSFYLARNDWSVDKRKLLDVAGTYYVFSISEDFEWPEIEGQPDTTVSYLVYGKFPGKPDRILLSARAITKERRQLYYAPPVTIGNISFPGIVDRLSVLNTRRLKEEETPALTEEYDNTFQLFLEKMDELFPGQGERSDEAEKDSIRFYLMPQALVNGKPIMDFSDIQAQENDNEPAKIENWDQRRPADDQLCPGKTPREFFWEKIREDSAKICNEPRFRQICDSLRSWRRRGKLKMEPEMKGVSGETDVFNGDVTLDGTDYLQGTECRISVLLHEFSHVIDNGASPPVEQQEAQRISTRLKEIEDELSSPEPDTDKDALERERETLNDQLKALEPALGRAKLRSECYAYKFIRDHADFFGDPERVEWNFWASQEIYESYSVVKKFWDNFKDVLTPEGKAEFCHCMTEMLGWIEHEDRSTLKRILKDLDGENAYQKIKDLKEEACR